MSALHQYQTPHTHLLEYVANHRDPDVPILAVTCTAITLWDPTKTTPVSLLPIASIQALYVRADRDILIRTYGREDVYVTSPGLLAVIRTLHAHHVAQNHALCPSLPIFTIDANPSQFIKKGRAGGAVPALGGGGSVLTLPRCPCNIPDDMDETQLTKGLKELYICYAPEKLCELESEVAKGMASGHRRKFYMENVFRFGPTPSEELVTETWRREVKAMYETYNPTKLPELETILQTYQHQKLELLRALIEKYGPEPEAARLTPQDQWWETELLRSDQNFRTLVLPPQLGLHTAHGSMMENVSLGTAASTAILTCSALHMYIGMKRVRLLPIAHINHIFIHTGSKTVTIRCKYTSDIQFSSTPQVVLHFVEMIALLHGLFLDEEVCTIPLVVEMECNGAVLKPNVNPLQDMKLSEVPHIAHCPCWPKEKLGVDQWKTIVYDICIVHCPERLPNVEKDMEEYMESRKELLEELTTRYGPIPTHVQAETVWRARIKDMYEKNDPSKLSRLDQICDEYSTRKVELLCSLMDRFGVGDATDPNPLAPISDRSPPRSSPVTSLSRNDVAVKSFQQRIANMMIVYDLKGILGMDEFHAVCGSGSEEKVIQDLVKTYGPEPNEATVASSFTSAVRKLYEQNDPHKLRSLDDIVSEYSNRKVELLRSLLNKYVHDPCDPLSSTQSSLLERSGTLSNTVTEALHTTIAQHPSFVASSFVMWKHRVSNFLVYYAPEKLASIEDYYAAFDVPGGDEGVIRELIDTHGPEPSEDAVDKQWVLRVKDVYEKFCPGKLSSLDVVLDQYRHSKGELLRSLLDKYVSE
eukprot:PhF_6_TR37469/c0_g1_i1/m.55172